MSEQGKNEVFKAQGQSTAIPQSTATPLLQQEVATAVASTTARPLATCCIPGDGDGHCPHDQLAIAISLGPPYLAIARVSPGQPLSHLPSSLRL